MKHILKLGTGQWNSIEQSQTKAIDSRSIKKNGKKEKKRKADVT